MDSATVDAAIKNVNHILDIKGVSKGALVKAFIKARHPEKYVLATNRDDLNQQAFDSLALDVSDWFELAAGAPIDIDSITASEPSPTSAPIITVVCGAPRSNVDTLPVAADGQPSFFLRNPEFRRNMSLAFPLAESVFARLSNPETLTAACAAADALGQLLSARLIRFITTSPRFKADSHRNALCWKFTATQLNRLSAIVVAHGHIGTVEVVNATQCGECLILRPRHKDPQGEEQTGANFFRVEGTSFVGGLQGCYLYFCTLMKKWFRAGATSGTAARGMLPRHGEHSACARLLNASDLTSALYTMYSTPAGAVRWPDVAARRGSWDKVVPFVGVGFQRVQSEQQVSIATNLVTTQRGLASEATGLLDQAKADMARLQQQLRAASTPAPTMVVATPLLPQAVQQQLMPPRHDSQAVRRSGRGRVPKRRPSDEEYEGSRIRKKPSGVAKKKSRTGSPLSPPDQLTIAAIAKKLKEQARTVQKARLVATKAITRLDAFTNTAADARKSRKSAIAMCTLFNWNCVDFGEHLQNRNWNQRGPLQKKAGVLAYMFESSYDLMLNVHDNISRSPGFERFLPSGGQ